MFRFLIGLVAGALMGLGIAAYGNEYVLTIPLVDFVRPDYKVMCEQIHERAIRIYRDLNPEQTANE